MHTANSVLSMDLDFLNDIDIETMMKIRGEGGAAFENFRRELDRQLGDLRQVTDQTVRMKMENIKHDLLQIEVPRLNEKLVSLRNKVLAEAGIVTGSLLGSSSVRWVGQFQ